MSKKSKLQLILRVLFILSLLFVVIYLFRQDWLKVPAVHSPILFGLSIILVVTGFLADAGTWRSIIRHQLPLVSYKHAVISSGKYVFAKYIPGKFWIVLGKAGYIKEKYGESIITLSSYSVVNQIIAIVAALLLSIAVIPHISVPLFLVILLLTAIILIILLFFRRWTFRTISSLSGWLLGRQIIIPELSGPVIIRTLFLSLVAWLMWAAGFFMLSKSLYPGEMLKTIQMGLLFPASAAIGIIVLFAPGGLGIREGALVFGLVALGLTAKEAASIAFLSRIWFLAGEVLFFITAMLLSLRK